MRLGSNKHRLNDCNTGLTTWKRCWRSSISNRKTYTTWMKADLQSVKRKQGGVLSILLFVNSFRQSLGVKSVLQLWSAFAPMEALFHLSSFSKRKIFQHNGFQ